MTPHSSPENEPTKSFTGTRWRHLKRGTSYEVVGVAKLQTALTEGLADETPMVVYRNEATGKLSVRSVDEFCDGRFERLGGAAPAQRLPDKLDLIRIIARNIDCEKECQHAPESCGCAVDAADAILYALTSTEQYDPAFVEEIKRAAAAPPEAEFKNAQEVLDYLNGIAPLPRPDGGEG